MTIGGGIKCWGYNGNGQLGDGTNTHSSVPVDVFGISSGASGISGGGWHTCALMTGGGVKCWGANWYGQLGDGTTTDQFKPVDVVGFEGGPNGNITSPANNSTFYPSSLQISANASPANSSSTITQVEFFARYDGTWHQIGIDTTSPYQVTWQIPDTLHSQQIPLRIDVLDSNNNKTVQAGGVVIPYYREFNTSGNENWISRRAYLNQRPLTNGDAKCNVASMAMVMAMNGVITSDYTTMANKANEMYDYPLC